MFSNSLLVGVMSAWDESSRVIIIHFLVNLIVMICMTFVIGIMIKDESKIVRHKLRVHTPALRPRSPSSP